MKSPFEFIIIEGPDGSGKSPLAARLAKETSSELVHCGPIIGDPFLEYSKMIKNYRGKKTVFDRFFHSETVYGPVLRGEQRLDILAIKRLEKLLPKTLLILLLPPLDDTIGNILRKKDDLISPDMVQNLLDGYYSILGSTTLQKIVLSARENINDFSLL